MEEVNELRQRGEECLQAYLAHFDCAVKKHAAREALFSGDMSVLERED